MKSHKSIGINKLISPIIIQNNENEKKNESPLSEKKILVRPVIKPQPLNLNLITEINGKPMNKKETLFHANMDFFGKSYVNKLNASDISFSK